jgi:hypothetical protein
MHAIIQLSGPPLNDKSNTNLPTGTEPMIGPGQSWAPDLPQDKVHWCVIPVTACPFPMQIRPHDKVFGEHQHNHPESRRAGTLLWERPKPTR